jgi:hypothetical protein
MMLPVAAAALVLFAPPNPDDDSFASAVSGGGRVVVGSWGSTQLHAWQSAPAKHGAGHRQQWPIEDYALRFTSVTRLQAFRVRQTRAQQLLQQHQSKQNDNSMF